MFVKAYEKTAACKEVLVPSPPEHSQGFEDALKNLDSVSTHYIALFGNLSQLYLVFIERSKVGTIANEFGGL